MLFNSFGFLVFFPLVFLLHWTLGRGSVLVRNGLLLAASLFFYAAADARAMPILLACAVANYAVAIGMAGMKHERKRRALFWVGVSVNIGVLCFFKYFDFFHEGISGLLASMGLRTDGLTLRVMLPLGLSFLTFQMLGYLIDVSSEEITPTRSPLAFLTYVFFFPKILAGPVERIQRFLPQIAHVPTFDPRMIADGFRQALWGFFTKVVIADHADAYVDKIFDGGPNVPGSALLLAAFLYFVQIYCDFSGYSNIAIGLSKMMGIQLMTNFARPFFATSVSDFWKRWHISLTSWMMEYLFTPLSFILRGAGRWGTILSISVIFFTVGIWHGANWAFVLFGTLQSLYFLPLAFANAMDRTSSYPVDRFVPTGDQAIRVAGTFTLMMFSFILLRTEDVGHTFDILSGIFSGSLFASPGDMPRLLLMIVMFFLAVEWVQRGEEHALRFERKHWPVAVRVLLCYGLLLTTLWYGGAQNEFIYFQF